MTPAPDGQVAYENPSIICSDDGNTWSVPVGLTNPIDPQPTPYYNSDTDIIVDSGGVMWCYYLESTSGSGNDYVQVRSSSDGITWSAQTTLITDVYPNMESPAIVYDGTQYVMWHIDPSHTPYQLSRRICSTPNGTWSSASACTIINKPAGKDLWHIDVVKRGQIYNAFIVCCNSGDTGLGSILYFATSTDGITWTLNLSPLLSPSAGWDNERIYRSSGISTATGYDLWYPAYDLSNHWHIGRTTVTLS